MDIRGEWFDHDPLTGITEYYEETSDGKIHIHTYQDVEPIMEHCKALKNSGLPDDNWQKNGVSVYAIIPAVLQGALYKKGINFIDPNHVGEVVRQINVNYPNFKTTYKHHAVRQR